MAQEPPNSQHKGRATIHLSPMEVPKASDVLANELRERILSGEFKEGTPLPSERELVLQTKMSRTTVREALRILEVQALVRIRAGRAGGAFVQRPDRESVARSVSMLIRGRQIRLKALHETREGLEPYCAQLAAIHRTDADLVALDDTNRAIEEAGDNLDAFLRANIDWHLSVAAASHNEILAGFMTALSQAIFAATKNESFINDEIRSATANAHRLITESIKKQDAEGARRRMGRHISVYADAVKDVEVRTAIPVVEDGQWEPELGLDPTEDSA